MREGRETGLLPRVVPWGDRGRLGVVVVGVEAGGRGTVWGHDGDAGGREELGERGAGDEANLGVLIEALRGREEGRGQHGGPARAAAGEVRSALEHVGHKVVVLGIGVQRRGLRGGERGGVGGWVGVLHVGGVRGAVQGLLQ